MRLIIQPRGSGKTTDLIKRSAETGYRIITATVRQVEYIEHLAIEMNLEIPEPVPIKHYLNFMRGIKKDEAVLIDNLDFVLSTMLETKIDTVTMSFYD